MNFQEKGRRKGQIANTVDRGVRNICYKIDSDNTYSGQWAPPRCRDFQMEILKLTLRRAENICDLPIQTPMNTIFLKKILYHFD